MKYGMKSTRTTTSMELAGGDYQLEVRLCDRQNENVRRWR
jgi:hypothetical protein